MATTKKPVEAEETKVEEKPFDEAAYWAERVPITLPLNQGNPEDQTLFVSVNDYTAQIQRGVEVMVPRNVAEVIRQSIESDKQAFMRRLELQNQYEAEARRH